MAVNIGLVIWKEMKARSVSRDQLALKTGIPKHRLTKIMQSASIETEILVNISTVLETNLFEYYYQDLDFTSLNHAIHKANFEERDKIIDILHEKNKVISLQEVTIKSQAKTIKLLESLVK